MDQIISRWCYYVSFLLKGQGRFLWTIILASALLMYLFNLRKALVSGIVEDVRMVLVEKKAIIVLWIFICWGVIVSMLNFHLGRYSLFILPSLCFLVAQSFLAIYEKMKMNVLKPVCIAVLLIMPLPYYASNIFNFDADMGFMDVIRVHKLTLEYLNKSYESGTVIMDSFPITSSMNDTRAGYAGRKNFKHLDRSCSPPEKIDADLFVYTYPGNLEQCKPETNQLALLKEFKSSFARVLIYTKK